MTEQELKEIEDRANAATDIPELIAEIRKLWTEREKLVDALKFYADVLTRPVWETTEDCSETPSGLVPGKRARIALGLEEGK